MFQAGLGDLDEDLLQSVVSREMVEMEAGW